MAAKKTDLEAVSINFGFPACIIYLQNSLEIAYANSSFIELCDDSKKIIDRELFSALRVPVFAGFEGLIELIFNDALTNQKNIMKKKIHTYYLLKRTQMILS